MQGTAARVEATTETDAEIIAASATDPSLFGTIFQRHHNCVFTFVARRLGRNDAADVVSEVFLRAFRSRHKYDSRRECCRPWLFGIAYNIVGDRLRQRSRHNRSFIYSTADTSTADYDEANDRLVAQPATDELNAALTELNPGDRDALLLFALEDLSYDEIAQVLKIPKGTVGSRLARARRQIRESIPHLEQITDRMVNGKVEAS